MKKIKKVLLMTLVCLAMLSFASFEVTASYEKNTAITGVTLYSPQEVALALVANSKVSLEKDIITERVVNNVTTLLDDVLLPASMGIETPNIDMTKIEKTILISTLDPAFLDAVAEHAPANCSLIYSDMTLSEYYALEDTWVLPNEIIITAKLTYEELQDVDMSKWTYGTYKAFYAKRNLDDRLSRFTPTELRTLQDRGVQFNDIMYLFKEFHTPDNILAQSDDTLRQTIEGYYEFTLDGIMSSITRVIPPSQYYTLVNFPRYGGDYFHNSVLTTTYYQQLQADRTLRTQKELYNNTSNTLCTTNMHGTFSQSQLGAHEGIDFTHPSGTATPTIRAVFKGTRYTTNALSHQLSVYDANSPDYPKTYNYLHMNSITAGTSVTVKSNVGTQGNQGNATGYHVHFEVQEGNTRSLSPGNDHVVGSLSPYRLDAYIGEL